MKRRRSAPFALLLALPLACLPSETRSPPASLTVMVSAGQNQVGSVLYTADGWALRLRRLYANLGGVELTGEDCEGYSERGYTRILDLSRPQPQKVSSTYGLGTCSLAFVVSEPHWNTIAGDGVSPEWVERFRTPASDGETDGGISLYVEGEAEKDATIVRFAWPFRPRVAYSDCRRLDEEAVVQPLRLRSEDSQTLQLELDVTTLFRPGPAADEMLFDDLAAADAAGPDPSGELTLEELRRAPSAAPPAETLLDELYHSRLPGMVRLVDGACSGRIETCDDECEDD